MSIILGGPSYATGGLLLYLDASNTGGGSTWTDRSGTGNNVTMNGSPSLTTLAGYACYRFTAAGQYFTGTLSGTQPSTDLTIDCWIYPEAEVTSGDRGTLLLLSGGSSAYMSWNKSSQVMSNYWYGHSPEGYHETGAAVSRNTWNRFGAVWNYSKGTITQWTNNTRTYTSTSGTPATGSSINIGQESSSRQFAGGIAIMMVYNRALSDNEMRQNYAAFSPRFSGGPLVSGTGITFNDSTTQASALSETNTGGLISVERFQASGTWYRPAGCTRVRVQVVGGGGGGCGYCESGGAGGYAEGVYNVENVSSISVTVGGGGQGAGYYQGCPGGGTSSFGSYISASGGGGANTYSGHSGGHGGSGSGGQINLTGGGGSGHTNSVGHWSGGRGGASYFGGASAMLRNHGNQGGGVPIRTWTAAPGSGGPGNVTDGSADNKGGQGESGLVIVYSYK